MAARVPRRRGARALARAGALRRPLGPDAPRRSQARRRVLRHGGRADRARGLCPPGAARRWEGGGDAEGPPARRGRRRASTRDHVAAGQCADREPACVDGRRRRARPPDGRGPAAAAPLRRAHAPRRVRAAPGRSGGRGGGARSHRAARARRSATAARAPGGRSAGGPDRARRRVRGGASPPPAPGARGAIEVRRGSAGRPPELPRTAPCPSHGLGAGLGRGGRPPTAGASAIGRYRISTRLPSRRPARKLRSYFGQPSGYFAAKVAQSFS